MRKSQTWTNTDDHTAINENDEIRCWGEQPVLQSESFVK